MRVHSRVAMVVAALVLMTAAVTTFVFTRPSGWRTGGPVLLPIEHGYVVRYQTGQVFTDGLERVKLTGNQSAVLRRVEITGPSVDHFKVVGIMVAGPHRTLGSWEVSDGFPPHKPRLGRLVPGIGATLTADGLGSLLLIGIEVVKPGLGIRTGLNIYYTVGNKKYVARYSASIANCPSSMTDMQCQAAYIKAAQSS